MNERILIETTEFSLSEHTRSEICRRVGPLLAAQRGVTRVSVRLIGCYDCNRAIGYDAHVTVHLRASAVYAKEHDSHLLTAVDRAVAAAGRALASPREDTALVRL